MKKYMYALVISLLSNSANADSISITIITEILPVDPVSGMKSTHNVSIDTTDWTATNSYTTGTTFGVPSVDDSFTTEISTQPDNTQIATIAGTTETGMGLGFAPAINYTVYVDFSEDGSFKVFGRHDGYPAYRIEIDNNKVYQFEHKSLDLAKLAEPQEITISKLKFSPQEP